MPGNYADNTDYTAKRTSKVKKKKPNNAGFIALFIDNSGLNIVIQAVYH